MAFLDGSKRTTYVILGIGGLVLVAFCVAAVLFDNLDNPVPMMENNGVYYRVAADQGGRT